MLIPDYNDLLNEDINRFALTAGVAKIAGMVNERALEQLKYETAETKAGKPFVMSDELKKMLDEKPVTVALEKLIAGKDELVPAED